METKFTFGQKVYILDGDCAYYKGTITGIYSNNKKDYTYTVEFPQGHRNGLKEEQIYTSVKEIIKICEKQIEKESQEKLKYLYKIGK